ncbi:hypothetical protein ACF1UB_001239 [Vibrio fluvialis]|uniref:hypothetical protein n=1 Tax=Vibrio furnissii TaxID=29494 RepID=UPI0012AD8F37|nr:hypothetical protein [Vibrio furnissii]
MKQFDKREVIGGLLVLFVGVLIGSFWLADIATPVQAFFTSLGSLATALTLVFLFVQNMSQAKELKEERDDRKAHEDAQKNMWQEQREMLTFQKLQMHKSMFNDLLNEVERFHGVSFYDRVGLYKKCFPNNNLGHFNDTLQSSLSNKNNNGLSECADLFLKAVGNKGQKPYLGNDLLQALMQLSQKLHLSLPNKNNFGDISLGVGNNTLLITNIFSLSRTITIYTHTFERLYDFCGLEFDYEIAGHNFDTHPLFDYVFRTNNIPFDVEFGKMDGPIKLLYGVLKNINRNSSTISQQLHAEVLNVEGIFEDGLTNKTDKESALILFQSIKSLGDAVIKISCYSDYLDNSKNTAESQLQEVYSAIQMHYL